MASQKSMCTCHCLWFVQEAKLPGLPAVHVELLSNLVFRG